jgi:transposase InsO family protein
MQHYRSLTNPRSDLRARMRDIARTRVRYCYRRIHVLLRRDGWKFGKDQTYRMYREEQLQLRSTLPKRRKRVVTRPEQFRPLLANEVCSCPTYLLVGPDFGRSRWWPGPLSYELTMRVKTGAKQMPQGGSPTVV